MTYMSTLLTSDLGQIVKVNIFLQGWILSSINGSKLIFHKRMYMYLYETSHGFGSWDLHGPLILPYILKTNWWTKCYKWDIGYMWCKDLPHKMYVSQRPTFHGPMILSHILKTIRWMNVVLICAFVVRIQHKTGFLMTLLKLSTVLAGTMDRLSFSSYVTYQNNKNCH